MAEKRVVELEVKTTGAEQSEKSVKSLKARLRELKTELQGLDEGSDQFKKLVREAGELQDTIGDLNQQVKNFASDTRRLDAALEGIGAVAGAFGVVESSLALVGIESEELQKTMVRLQAAMTLVNSVQSIANALQKESALMTGLSSIKTNLLTKATVQQAVATGTATVAQRIMNAVMKANPIFLIIGAVTALIGAYSLLTGSTENLEEKNEKLNKSYEESNKQIERLNNQASNRIKNNLAILESAGASEKEIFQERLNLIEQEEKARQKQLDIEFKYLKEKHKAYDKANKRGNEELKETISQEIKATIDKINSLQDKEDDYVTSKIVLGNQYSKFLKDKNKEEIEEANRKKDEKIKLAEEEAKRIKELRRKDLQEISDIEEQAHLNKLAKTKEREEAYAEAVANARKLNIESGLSDEEKELLAIKNKYAKIEELGELNKDLIDAQLSEEKAIKDKYRKLDVDSDLAVQQQKAAIQQQGLDTAFQGVQLIKNLFEKQKGVQKAAVIAESAIGIAKMIISNKLANAGALATPQAIATSGAAAAPVIAMNNISTGIGIAANIAATAKALKTLGGGSPPDGSNPNGGGGSAPNQVITPNFNLVGQSGANTLGMQTQPLQAYVVSGEVTSQQALDRNRLKNATFG